MSSTALSARLNPASATSKTHNMKKKLKSIHGPATALLAGACASSGDGSSRGSSGLRNRRCERVQGLSRGWLDCSAALAAGLTRAVERERQ